MCSDDVVIDKDTDKAVQNSVIDLLKRASRNNVSNDTLNNPEIYYINQSTIVLAKLLIQSVTHYRDNKYSE